MAPFWDFTIISHLIHLFGDEGHVFLINLFGDEGHVFLINLFGDERLVFLINPFGDEGHVIFTEVHWFLGNSYHHLVGGSLLGDSRNG